MPIVAAAHILTIADIDGGIISDVDEFEIEAGGAYTLVVTANVDSADGAALRGLWVVAAQPSGCVRATPRIIFS